MKTIVFIALGVIVIALVSSAFYVVQEYEQVIITQFGKPVGKTVNTPGLKMKLPMIQKVNRFEKRFLEWDGEANQLPTKDKRFIWVNSYARWQISDPLLYFQRLHDERGAQTRLDDILDGETRNAIAKYDLVEVVRSSNRTPVRTEAEEADEQMLEPVSAGRDQIRQEVLAKAKERTSDLGIEILDVQFKRINYIEDVSRKVYERMIAERRRIADRYRSEGEGEASRIRGQKERELLRIQSQAYRQAEEIKGKADAQAARIYASAYDRSAQTRDFYEFLKTMESYPAVLDSTSQLILSTDSEFYRFLKRAE